MLWYSSGTDKDLRNLTFSVNIPYIKDDQTMFKLFGENIAPQNAKHTPPTFTVFTVYHS